MEEIIPDAHKEQHTEGQVGSEPMVVVEQLVKQFGKLRAVNNLNMTIFTGEVYGLLGPNGSGKTTLIRMLVGLVAPDAGEVTVLGARMPDLAVLGRIGYMTQAAALYTDLSVEENVRFFAAVTGAEKNVAEAIDIVELSDRRDSVVSTLSGGMRQRASLACALVHQPQLLLLDEPTVGI